MADTGGIESGDRAGADRAGSGRGGRNRLDDDARTRALIAGLDAQAHALSALEDAEAADELERAEIARTTWADRMRALVSGVAGGIEVELPDGRLLGGDVVAVLADGLQLVDGTGSWLIRRAAVTSIVGLGSRTRVATRIEQRLGVVSVLREWAQEQVPVQCVSARGVREGTVTRVGADHIDLAEHDRGEAASVRGVRTLTLDSLWVVRSWQ